MLTPTSGSITWRSALSTASVPGTARAQRTRRIRVDPMEVLEVLADLRVRKILVRHRQIVELLHHRLRHGIALEHLLGRLQPSRKPRVVAALRDAREIGTELLALPHGVAGEALALRGGLALPRA